MNISSNFTNIGDIKTFINQLNETMSQKKDTSISRDKIQEFIKRHLNIIANSGNDKELHDSLINLSNHINDTWRSAEAHNLAFEVMGIAKGVFKEPGQTLPELPQDAWGKILSFTPPRGKKIRFKQGGGQSGLENFYPSTELLPIAQKAEKEWGEEELVSLKKYGCSTAEEAIQYAIDHKLSGVNLKKFPDLTEDALNKLFDNCPNLNSLLIQSDIITRLPDKTGSLKRLDCSNCPKLQSLPALPSVQEIDCSFCSKLQSLPELPSVQRLDCSSCKNLQSLPGLPRVQKLDCSFCSKLQSLPELPSVQELNCIGCPKLQSLPELPSVHELWCRGCPKLQSLPKLPPQAIVYR